MKEVVAVALFGAFCLFSDMAKGCTWFAYTELQKAGLKLRVIPHVVIGSRAQYAAGVVTLTNTEDCRVVIHEFVHAWQDQQRGQAKSEAEWWSRERDAAIVTERIWE